MNKTHIAGKAFALFALSLTLAGGFSVSNASAAVGYGGGATSFGGGGGGSSCPSFLVAPPEGFRVTIPNEDSAVYSRNVVLTLNGGNAPRMAISNSATFEGASIEDYAPTKAWTLSEGEGEKMVFVRFYDNCGTSTAPYSATVRFANGRPANLPAPGTPANGTGNGNNGNANNGNTNSGNNNGGLGPVNFGNGIVLGERIALIDELVAKVRFGQRSADVLTLQRELIRLGFMPRSFRATNYYGTFTRAGVNAYLASLEAPEADISVDIDQLIASTRFGTRSESVRSLQRELIRLGYLRLRLPTNYFGALTRDAVRRYQAAR